MSCSWSRSLQIYEWLPEACKIYLILFSWIISSISILSALLLMEELLHQVRLVVYPIIYRVLYIPGGAESLPSTVSSSLSPSNHLQQSAHRSTVKTSWGTHLYTWRHVLAPWWNWERWTFNTLNTLDSRFFAHGFLMKMSLDFYKPAFCIGFLMFLKEITGGAT